jgi:hypothetical protein
MQPLFSINGAADAVGKDRSVITRVLRNVPPDSRAQGKAKFRLSTVVDALLADAVAGAGDSAADLANARTRQAVARAAKSEFDLEVDQGKWCKMQDAVDWMQAVIIVCRERLLSLAGELGNDLTAEQREEIDDKIREALTELGNPKTFLQLSRRYNALDRAEAERKKEIEDATGD